MFGIVIDKETKFVTDKCVVVNEYESKENEEVIQYEYEKGNPVCNMNKPQWTGSEWIDTEPLPPVEPPIHPPTQDDKISILQEENRLLKAQVSALNMTTDFHEECLAEIAMIVYA